MKLRDARDAYIQLLPEMARLFKPELIRKGLFYKPEVAAAAAVPVPVNTPGPFQLSPLAPAVGPNARKTRRRVKSRRV